MVVASDPELGFEPPDPSSVLDGSEVEVGVPVDELPGGVPESPPEPPFALDWSGELLESLPAPSPPPSDPDKPPNEVGGFLLFADPFDEDDEDEEDPLPWAGLWL